VGRILPKVDFSPKNQNFVKQKSKILPKNRNFVNHGNFGKKLKFSSKIEIFVKN